MFSFLPNLSDNFPDSGIIAVNNSIYIVTTQVTKSNEVCKLLAIVGNAGENMKDASAVIKTPNESTSNIKVGNPPESFLTSSFFI